MNENSLKKEFEISAPGKVILHGEHSAVYGKPAIAGPIGLRTHLKFKELDENKIKFNFESITYETSITLDDLHQFLLDFNCFETIQPLDFLNTIRNDYTSISKYLTDKPDESNNKAKTSIAIALYMLNRIFKSEKIEKITKGFEIVIKSDMSIGAGMGSSATYGVCLSAAFLIYAQRLNGRISDCDITKFSLKNEEILEQISKFAFDSETVTHEKPSGIDNTICTYGNLIKFCKGQPVVPINLRNEIHILIVDTGVSRTTSKLVAHVANLRKTHSKLIDSIMDALGYLVDDVVKILESDSYLFEELKTLISINHNLLRALGVSHSSLEEIFGVSEANGFSCKLTGAGGGGCALIFLPSNYEDSEQYKKLTSALAKDKWMKTTIGGSGVEYKHIA